MESKKERVMTEQTSRKPKFAEHISPEAREHMKAAREEMRKGFEAMMPAGFKELHQHRRAARKEMLLAWRSMIDSAINKMDEK
jgi:BMFP domain-containing protein YqiC